MIMFEIKLTIGFNAETQSLLLALIGAIGGGSPQVINGAAPEKKAFAAKPLKSVPASTPSTNGQETVAVTVEMLRELSSSKAQISAEAKTKVKAIINAYGVKSVSQVPEENHTELYNQLKAV